MDQEKIDACKQLGITLLIVPYWWNLRQESVAVSLYHLRPELFPTVPIGMTYEIPPTKIN